MVSKRKLTLWVNFKFWFYFLIYILLSIITPIYLEEKLNISDTQYGGLLFYALSLVFGLSGCFLAILITLSYYNIIKLEFENQKKDAQIYHPFEDGQKTVKETKNKEGSASEKKTNNNNFTIDSDANADIMDFGSNLFHNSKSIMLLNLVSIYKEYDFYLSSEDVFKIALLNVLLITGIGFHIASLTSLYAINMASVVFGYFAPIYLALYELIEGYIICRKF